MNLFDFCHINGKRPVNGNGVLDTPEKVEQFRKFLKKNTISQFREMDKRKLLSGDGSWSSSGPSWVEIAAIASRRLM